MADYVISVWNNVATIFRVNEDDEKLSYEKIDLPKNNSQEIQEFVHSLIDDITENRIYPLSHSAKRKLIEMGFKL